MYVPFEVVAHARFIEATRNAEIEGSIKKKGKVLIYVINKSDLKDKLEDLPAPYVIVSCKERKGVKQLRNKIKENRINKPLNWLKIAY